MIRSALVFFSLMLAAQSQNTPPLEYLSAKLQASVEESGSLRATCVISGDGAVSIPFRDAYAGFAARNSKSPLGSYLQNRQMLSTPLVKGAGDPAQPIEIRLPIFEPEYLLPFHRQLLLQLDLFPPLADPVESNGRLTLGLASTRREEIVFEIPHGFAFKADSHINEDRPFAHYRSDAIVEGGKLVIIREFVLKATEVAASSRREVDSLWKLVHDDQTRTLVLRRIARTDPTSWLNSVPVYRATTLGLRAYDQREYETARQLFDKVIQAKPDDRFAWNNLGRALSALGRLTDAQRAYEKQIAINPADQYSYNNLGLVFERQGNWKEAIDSLQKQLQVHPGDRYAIANLPRALIHERRWAEVEAASTVALRVQPTVAQLKENIAIAHACLGKTDDARREIDAAMGSRPSTPLLNNAAYYLTECDRQPELAESYIRKALDQMQAGAASVLSRNMAAMIAYQNSLSTYFDTYGWMEFKREKYDRAIELLSAAATISPRGEVFAHLANAEDKAGHRDEAALHWRQAIFLEPGQRSQMPTEIAGKLESIPTLSLDHEWYPLKANLPREIVPLVQTRPSFFFAITTAQGGVESIRALDSEDGVAKNIAASLTALSFPPIQWEGRPIRPFTF
jgi:tetratricopeptide (TPR) repeat protein